jgi:hypothetical protein
MSYKPQVDDYVKWDRKQSRFTDEGWVYFKCADYITIEVGTKDKPDSLVGMHKKTHILVVCHSCYWSDLEYIKNRRNCNDENTIQ